MIINVKSKWGFALTRVELADLVHEFVKENKKKDSELGDYLKKYCKFKVRKLLAKLVT